MPKKRPSANRVPLVKIEAVDLHHERDLDGDGLSDPTHIMIRTTTIDGGEETYQRMTLDEARATMREIGRMLSKARAD